MMYQCGRMFSKYVKLSKGDAKEYCDVAARMGAVLHTSDDNKKLLTIESMNDREMDKYKASFICGSSTGMNGPDTDVLPSFISETVNGSVTI